jgi:hypothetical protein
MYRSHARGRHAGRGVGTLPPVGSSESYGRDFGIPSGHALEPGYEGEPPPERRSVWYYITAAIGAVVALGLYAVIVSVELGLSGTGFVDALFVAFASFWALVWAVPTVVAFILLIFKPTRGFATGFLAASAVGLLVCLAIPVFRSL